MHAFIITYPHIIYICRQVVSQFKKYVYLREKKKKDTIKRKKKKCVDYQYVVMVYNKNMKSFFEVQHFIYLIIIVDVNSIISM